MVTMAASSHHEVDARTEARCRVDDALSAMSIWEGSLDENVLDGAEVLRIMLV